MKAWRDEDVIEVLACDIDGRPDGPGPDALAPFVLSATYSATSITIDLDESGRQVAKAFVAAEQVCCSNIGWHLEEAPRFRLRIDAEPEQLSVLKALIPPSIGIETVQ